MTPLERYAAFWETITPAALDRLAEVMTDDARFKDPFNDARGRDHVAAVLRHMFTLGAVHFEVLDQAEGATASYLRWRCRIGTHDIAGMSEIRFAADGRVREHIDHWDAGEQFYEKLPLLGGVLRAIKRRLRPRDGTTV